MKFKILFLLLISFCLNESSFAQKKYQNGLGLYPISLYDAGHSIKYNFILSKNNHDFYIGLNTHINKDLDKWSNNQNAFYTNGAATKLIQYFHPNIGYTKYFNLKKDYPVSFLLNFDLQGGKMNYNSKYYYFGDFYTKDINATFLSKEGFSYLQFTINTGLKVNLNANFNIVGKVGYGISKIYYKGKPYSGELPGTYSLGITYLFNNKK